MKITRLYTGEDGESHLEDIELALDDKTRMEKTFAKSMKATKLNFWETQGNAIASWHNAPKRQYVIWIGKVEIELGDGSKRQFTTGDILLAEDTTGRGHITRNIGEEPLVSVIVELE